MWDATDTNIITKLNIKYLEEQGIQFIGLTKKYIV